MRNGGRTIDCGFRLPGADHPLIVDFNFGNSSGLGTTVDVQRRSAAARRGDRLSAPAGAGGAGRRPAELHRARPDRAAFPPVAGRSGLQPRDREPAVLGSRRRRMGGAELRAERREVDGESSGVSARAAREGAVAAARFAAEPGLHVPARRRRRGRRTAGVRRPIRSDRCRRGRSTAARCGSTARTFVRLKVQAVRDEARAASVVSNDETQIFEPSGEHATAGRSGCPVRVSNQQIFLIAGRNGVDRARSSPLGRRAEPPDFDQRAERRPREQADHVPRHRRKGSGTS